MNYPNSLLYALLALLALQHTVHGLPKECKAPPRDPVQPDYCEEEEQPHVACNNSALWAKVCGRNRKLIALSSSLKKLILNTHNQYRNTVAKGILQLPPAKRMLKLNWDVNLAYLAKYAVKLCRLRRPVEAFSTPTSYEPGFNSIYNKHPNTEEHDLQKVLRAQMKIWFDQVNRMSYNDLTADVSKRGRETGHFKQMMIGLNTRLGCAVSRYSDKEWTYQLLICMYGCGKKIKQKTYANGKYPGESCLCGVTREYKYLCHNDEPTSDCGLIIDHDLETNVNINQRKGNKMTRPTQKKSRRPWYKDLHRKIYTQM